MNILKYVDAVMVLTLRRRLDRLAHAKEEIKVLGFDHPTDRKPWIFHGYDKPNGNGNQGCTESHRAILEVIRWSGWNHTLVLEDDFAVRKQFRENFNTVLDEIMAEVPLGFKILYLGGGYASDPKRRVSKHIIEIDRMMTTSSFIISADMAEEMAPHISGVGPIDSLYGGFTTKGGCYCADPRLFYQYTSKSDLTDQEADYEPSMTDPRHEEMLLEGEWRGEISKGVFSFKGKIQRREISAPHDADGSIVIVGRDRYTIDHIAFPTHPAPWYKDELVTYYLRPEHADVL